jgi:hypothetical protein
MLKRDKVERAENISHLYAFKPKSLGYFSPAPAINEQQ